MTDTTELDLMMAAIAPRKVNEVLTDFVDWLAADGIVLASYGEHYDVRVPCPECCDASGVSASGRATVARPKVKGAGGLDISRLTARDKQILSIVAFQSSEHLSALLKEIPCPRCHGEVWVLVERVRDDVLTEHHEPYERLFARFLGIDLDLVEQERRALLEELCDANAAREADREAV